ncbi:MAG: transglycosylase SLT domain-containing protein [Prevotella sp.]|nr:transglycosylase SLT domain-containing protein [Prevotella sp.]
MNKKILLIAAMLLSGLCSMQAQIEVDDEEDEDDVELMEGDDDEEDEETDEVTIIDQEGNEEEFEFPEAMDYDLDSLLNLYHSKTYLTPDDDCRMTDENPVFSKEVYIDRLRRMPTIMEMPYNEVVEKFIERYTGRLRHSVSFMLGAANFYMPLFEEALEAYQLPLELKYLPVIESALKPSAVSRVGATGLWQFMLTTGKDYGLQVNNYIDERRDPVKASYAAAHYLSDLYKIFGDWNLVIAAYNCGPANINKAIHRAGGDKDYWKIYPFLPRETRGYVPAFIAANYVMNYYCEHNICPMRSQLPLKTDTVVVNRNVDLRQIAAVLGIDIEMLRALNPVYRRDVVPGLTKPTAIRMLPNDVVRFIDQQDSICNYNASNYFAKRDEVEVDEGRPVVVRSKGKTTRSKRQAARSKKARRQRTAKAGSVTVRKGDTLGAIAKRNGTTVAKLKKLNGLRGNNIQAGKKIRVK